MWIQSLVSLFVVCVIWRLIANYQQHRIPLRTVISWSLLWVVVVVIFWSPEIASRLAVFFGIGRGADLIVYSAIIIIVYLVYRIFIQLEKIKSDVTTLTREIALRHESKKDNRSDSHHKL